MTNKRQEILFASADTFEGMCSELLRLTAEKKNMLKITIFNAPSDSEEYFHNLRLLKAAVNKQFGKDAPLVAYVAQPCLTAKMAAEITYLPEESDIRHERYNGYTLLHGDGFCELITEGITPHSTTGSIKEQSDDIFAQLGDVLAKNNFDISDIYRQWNYIEQITLMSDGRQNYQEFNDARSRFYNCTKWTNGYPAATGIGSSCGGVMVEVYAIKGEKVVNHAIDNPLQTSAHSYSQRVLTGISDEPQRTTPKFERARIVGDNVYISGTAAIRGEDSLALDNAAEQTAETMQIIKQLVAPENIPVTVKGSNYTLLRVYIKNGKDAPEVIRFMDENYPDIPKHYLKADVCRPELLVEIEGTATIR